MKDERKTIAVTAMHRGQNPQPGGGVARGLRSAWPNCRIVGLIYDPLESAAYEPGLCDAVWTMPYPSCGREAWLERLAVVHAGERIDLLIPNLDSEIEILIDHPRDLTDMGLACTLPAADAFRRRSKESLDVLCREAGTPYPKTRVADDQTQLADLAAEIGWPVVVKGRLYGASVARDPYQLASAAYQVAGAWGFPVLLQEFIAGEEYNIAGLGDGHGGILGMVAQRKCLRSAEGKGLGGITVENPDLDQLTRRLVRALAWNGPFELEILRCERSGAFHVVEMNPRFPAWIELAVALGCNLPAAAAQLAMGQAVSPLASPAAGAMFVRHSIELVARVEDLGALSVDGHLDRHPTI